MPRDDDAERIDEERLEDEFAEDATMPGTHRGRVALVFGVVILLVIVAFLAWFIASNATRIRP